VSCPAGVPLSGGAFSSSSSPAVDLNSSIADQGGWSVFEDNTALIPGATIQAFVVCS
jgi:hypothetical protein